MPARIRKIRHDDETRAKIQTSLLIKRLMAHVMGEVDLTPAQVSSAKTLLSKVLPDLSAVDMRAELHTRKASDMTDDELATIASGGGRPADPPQVH